MTAAESDKQAKVVGLLLTKMDVAKCCQQSTDDRRLLIALSVQLCVQRDGRDGARRAGPSASAETWLSAQAVVDLCCVACVGVGRCKLNYRRFKTTVYRRQRNRPTGGRRLSPI